MFALFLRQYVPFQTTRYFFPEYEFNEFSPANRSFQAACRTGRCNHTQQYNYSTLLFMIQPIIVLKYKLPSTERENNAHYR